MINKEMVTRAIKNGYRPSSYIATGYEMTEDEVESTVIGLMRFNSAKDLLEVIKEYI